MTRVGPALLAGVIAILLAIWMTTPPQSRGPDAPTTDFAAGRAMGDIGWLGAAPHVAGTIADARVATKLRARLAGMGLLVEVRRVPLDERSRARLADWLGHPVPPGVVARNVVGVLPGRDPRAPALLLMAHHDTVQGSPGAADDSAGVAAILEIVRALRAGPSLQRDVIVLLTGGEELGLTGARAFFGSDQLAARAGMVINLETRGGGGRALMFETGAGNGQAIPVFARVVPWPAAASLSVTLYRLLPNSTDLTPAIARGHAGFNFAFTGRAALYHSPLATPARLDRGALQDMGGQALALTRALAEAPALPARAPDRAFADLWGTWLIHYPAGVGWVLLALAAALAGTAAWRLRGRVCGWDVARGAGVALPLLFGGTGLLMLVNWLSGAGAAANYYDRLAAIPRLEWQAACVCLALLSVVAGLWRRERWGGWLGLFAVVWIAGVAVQAVLPGGGPLLHWPLLASAATMVLAGPAFERRWGVAVIAGGATAQVLGYAHYTFLAMGAPMAGTMAPSLLLATLLLWPLVAGALPARRALAIAGVLFAAAIALALWVRLDPLAPSVPAYSVDKR